MLLPRLLCLGVVGKALGVRYGIMTWVSAGCSLPSTVFSIVKIFDILLMIGMLLLESLL